MQHGKNTVNISLIAASFLPSLPGLRIDSEDEGSRLLRNGVDSARLHSVIVLKRVLFAFKEMYPTDVL
jgi:hypothetical protein